MGEELHKGTIASSSASILRESCPNSYNSSHCPEFSQFSSSLYVPDTFGAASLHWSLEQVSLCADPLGAACLIILKSLVFLGMQSPVVDKPDLMRSPFFNTGILG